MASCTAVEITGKTAVGMGQIALARKPACLTAVLGSCVGVALYHKRLEIGALAHVVLPQSNGASAKPGKFADTAIPYMLQLLAAEGASSAGLIAKITGGSQMFGAGGPLQIGEDNRVAVTQYLARAGVRIDDSDLGGSKGRRITLDCGTGLLTIEVVGQPPRIL